MVNWIFPSNSGVAFMATNNDNWDEKHNDSEDNHTQQMH